MKQLDIKVYGATTSGHQMIVDTISDVLSRGNIEHSLEVVSDISILLDRGIESVPAIQIGSGHPIGLKSNGSFAKSLRSALQKMLAIVDYGDLPVYLVPIDFSKVSINALIYAQRMATDAKVVTKALHVFKPTPTVEGGSVNSLRSMEEAKLRLQDIAYKLDSDVGSDILTSSIIDNQFVVGFPEESILSVAEESSPEMIVVGTTGAGNALTRALGSVSAGVVQKASCPVLVVPPEAHYRGVNRILYAYDQQDIDVDTLPQLVTLAARLDADLVLAHVGAQSVDSVASITRIIDRLYKKDRVKLHRIEGDQVATSLLEYAKHESCEMIAVGVRRRSMLDVLLDDSVSAALIQQSNIPILVLK